MSRIRSLSLFALIAACSKSGGAPKPLATLDGDVSALAADATYVYATVMNLGKPSIVRIPKAGGAAEPLLAKTQVANGLAVQDGKLYWCEVAIEDAPSTGAVVVTGEDIQRHGGIAEAVSADAKHTGRVMVARASDGGSATELVRYDGVPMGLALDDRDIYVLSMGTWPTGGGPDATQGSVVAIAKAGGPVRVLADHLVRAKQLALDATSVSWIANGSAWTVAKSGGAPQRAQLAAKPAGDPFAPSLIDGKIRYDITRGDSKSTLTATAL